MGHLLCTISFIQVGILLVFMCSFTFSTENNISLEDKLKELENKLDIKVHQLEVKNIEIDEKNIQLEKKVAQLEIKIQQQEMTLISLLVQTNQSESDSNSILNNRQTAIQSTGKINGIPRTCQEIRAADPLLPSGMHWIDPDGQGVGDNPIYVYCDMLSGSTSILHDSESPINVGHCADPGCYSRFINYNASVKQIKTLIELSTECHQSLKYDCYYAPFELNNVAYAWWNDRNGIAQDFWAGNNTNGIHTCQCGINGNCVDSSVKCNCDVIAPVQLVDDGIITDKNVLPVTRLNFGRTQLETSSGIHTLGRFECTGSMVLTGLPTSCEDLWLVGHTLNGIYFINGVKMMESVYCDFTKLPIDAGFQKWIGYADVKSALVHFYVKRDSKAWFDITKTPIPFNLAVVNDGNAMNLETGKFTAPRPGTYFFSFTGDTAFPTSSSSLVYIWIALSLNGGDIGWGQVDEANNVLDQKDQVTVQSTLNLKKGDQVWVEIVLLKPGVSLTYCHLTGFMMEEEITGSL